MRNDAEHLLVLGKILGDDGWHFTDVGASVAQVLLVNHNLHPEPGMNDMAIQLWKDRQNMSTDLANQANLADRLRQTPAQGTPLSAKPLMAWALDLWRVQGYDEMKKCEFCGEAGSEETVLQACGRCRITLYCDRECQVLHWKKVHKKECKGKAKMKKEATSGEGSGTQ
ncbi:unnamed protein product [Zymoseptoria tritici ST99CH_3D7]|uniref:MYND-type domain-containing protein n=1 Tax=Zymoseptoria tritici (strain ST99CH_3D7) TaxID=1276538 RepID=A0A1X7S0G6_ZYMT9|nr:unnamed protein product [Zymoseptoria tritici ST99CH_3D7]